MRRGIKKIILVLIIIVAVVQAGALALLIYLNQSVVEKAALGTTFSPAQARYFGLDPKTVLIDSLDDLGIKNYRLSAYWDVIEPQKNKYDFSELDWQINEVEKRGGMVILAIGRRLPRWPECHAPAWTKNLTEEQAQERILAMLNVVVNKYKNRPAIKAWQVENEPFLSVFGECPPPDAAFYKKEVALAKSLDKRPIITTESGELSTWARGALYADKIGISLYRVTWNKIWGVFYYPLTPAYYRYRARAIRVLGKPIFVSELQAEPWELGRPLPETSILEQKKFIDGKKIIASVDFAKRASFDEIYLWGVEWWAWMKSRGDNEAWNTIKNLVKENN